MSSRFLTLPVELKLRIAELLIPFTAVSMDYQFDDCRTMADDINFILTSFRNLRNFSVTCSQLQTLYSHLVFQGMDLTNGEYRKYFMENLIDGTPPAPIHDATKTRFLSLGHFDSSDDCDEDDSFDLNKRDFTILTIFTHFSSITTLDLVDFPLSRPNIYGLASLKALRTLSIRDPDPAFGNFAFISMYRTRWCMPAVSNLSIVVGDPKAGTALNTILKFFEETIVMLSIRGKNKNNDENVDFLGVPALDLGNTTYINLVNLKQLAIFSLDFGPESFRKLVCNCRKLESLEIDCRGADGLLPVFYIFDILRISIGESDNDLELIDYDWIQAGYNQDPEMQLLGMHIPDIQDPYVTDAKIWRRRLSNFSCTFALVGSTSDRVKTITQFELVLASSDGNAEPINADVRLSELSEVFRNRASTFRGLETLSLAMSNEVPFESRESEDQLKDAVSEMCCRSLPSVKKFNLDWGQFQLDAERANGADDMKYVDDIKPRIRG